MIRIPESVVAFLVRAGWAHAATADASGKPAVHFVFGTIPSSDGTRLTCLVPEKFAGILFENLRANPRIAVTAGGGVEHINYQFKGRVVEVREPTPQERAAQKVQIDAAIGELMMMGFPKEAGQVLTMVSVGSPCRAVSFVVEEMFNQTPGPGAGERVEMAAA
jgi:hypothetical protein